MNKQDFTTTVQNFAKENFAATFHTYQIDAMWTLYCTGKLPNKGIARRAIKHVLEITAK